MRFWVVFWLLVAAAVGTFSVVNWQVLTARTQIDLLVAQITAPLGLVMLGGMAALALLFLLFLVWLETKALIQIGRTSRQAPVEPSGAMIAELRTELERHLSGLRGESSEAMRNIVARLEHMEQVVKDEVEHSRHALTAHVDRLEPHIKRVD